MNNTYSEIKNKFLKFDKDFNDEGIFDDELLHSLCRESLEYGFLDLYSRCMELMCNYYLKEGILEKYLQIYTEFEKIAQDKKGLLLLSCMRLEADYLANYCSEMNKAIELLKKALILYSEMEADSPQILFKLNQTLAIVYYLSGDYTQSIKYFYEALQCKLHKIALYQKGTIYVWIGTLENNRQNYSSALYNFLKAIEIFRKYNKELALSSVLLQRACVYLDLKKFPEAYNDLIQAFEIVDKHNFIVGKMGVYHRLGMYHRLTGNYAKCEEYLMLIKDENKQNTIHQGQVNLELAYLYSDTKSIEKAHFHFIKAAEIFKELNSNSVLFEIYVCITRLFLTQNMFVKAKEYIEIIETMQPEIYGLNYKKELYELYTKYYEGQKKYSKALQYSKMHVDVLSDLLEAKNRNNADSQAIKFEIEKRDL